MNLRNTLLLDAGSAALFVVLCLGMTARFAGMTGLPETVVAIAGWICVPSALLFLWQALAPSRPLLAMVVAGNSAWVLASVAIWLAYFGQITPLGHAFVIGQALAVAFFTLMEWGGLKSLRSAAAAV